MNGEIGRCVAGEDAAADAVIRADGSWPSDGGNNDAAVQDGSTVDAEVLGAECGDRHCSFGESFEQCPDDCPPPNRAKCVQKCGESDIACEHGDANKVACRDACAIASESAIESFLACAFPTTGDFCNLCKYGTLYQCGDGRCESFESFPNQVYCEQDCGPSNGQDCWFACLDYAEEGCIGASTFYQCLNQCVLSTVADRATFVACANPTSPAECSSLSCLTDYDVLCTDEDCGACGDGTCAAHESYILCPADCPSVCGDGACTLAEECLCTLDCGPCSTPSCGDGTCDGVSESCGTCPDDCGRCDSPSCFSDFSLFKTPVINSQAGLGAACNADRTNCLDGTSITFNDTGECGCTALCANVSGRPMIGESCAQGWTCQEAASQYGESAVMCVKDTWNLCTK